MRLESLKVEKLSPQQLKQVLGGSGAGNMITRTESRVVKVPVGNGQTREVIQKRDLVFSWTKDYEEFDQTCYEGSSSSWTEWY